YAGGYNMKGVAMRVMSTRVLLSLVITINVAALLDAQMAKRPPAIVPDDYGVQDYIYTEIPASDFHPLVSSSDYQIGLGNGSLVRTGVGGYYLHGISLPPGAYLADITAFVSDTSITFGNDVTVYLMANYRHQGTGDNLQLVNQASASTTGAPGDTVIVIPWNSTLPTVTDFDGDTIPDEVNWVLLVELLSNDGTNGFNLVRLKWKRQISPAPGTARFTDVPTTHAFFQYIEALAAAGITGGCSTTPPQY